MGPDKDTEDSNCLKRAQKTANAPKFKKRLALAEKQRSTKLPGDPRRTTQGTHLFQGPRGADYTYGAKTPPRTSTDTSHIPRHEPPRRPSLASIESDISTTILSKMRKQ